MIDCSSCIHSKDEICPANKGKCEYKSFYQAPSGDLISRQAVFEQIHCWIGSGEYRYTNATHYLTERVKYIQSVNPQEPKTGHWIEHPEIETSTPEYLMFYECSECGNKQCFYMADTHRRNYCGECGCRMVEPQETETWNGIHAQITAPKGTFERMFNETDDDNDI